MEMVEQQHQKHALIVSSRMENTNAFYAQLSLTLSILRCQPKFVPTWPLAQKELKRAPEVYSLLLIDLGVGGFEKEELHAYLTDLLYQSRPSILAICESGKEVSEIQILPIDGILHDEQSQYEIAYVLHRVLMGSQSEQRRYPRVLTSDPVKYTRLEDDAESFKSDLFNLSLGGAFIPSRDPFRPGTVLCLWLNLSDNKGSILCTAEVIFARLWQDAVPRLSPAGMGVRFLDISIADRVCINRHLSSRVIPIDRKHFSHLGGSVTMVSPTLRPAPLELPSLSSPQGAPLLWKEHINEGIKAFNQEEPAQAEERFIEALQVLVNVPGAEPYLTRSRHYVALACFEQGKLDKSREHSERSLPFGSSASDDSLEVLALVQATQRKLHEAGALFERVIPMKEMRLGKRHPALASTLQNYSRVLRDRGEHLDARNMSTLARDLLDLRFKPPA